MNSENVLELHEVSKRYGDFTAVNQVSLAIPKGAIYGFLGPNGAGKTTTIRMILDIIKPSSGTISILNHSTALQVRQRIGYLPEEKGLYKKMKAVEIISYFAMLKGMARRDAKAKAQELLQTYGLADFADTKVEALSKGMGQKVQVLSAVAHDPELVILDEPFSGLDPVNQEVLEELIHALAAKGSTVIFSTHVMQHAERLCDNILLIAKGRKIFDGSVEAARSIIPRRVLLESGDDVSPLQELEGVTAIAEQQAKENSQPDIKAWEVQITEAINPQNILQKCFEAGIALNRFDYTRPTLHDVFVHLVGSDAKEHSFR